MRFTERLDEIGAQPSIETVADTFDNALAETTNVHQVGIGHTSIRARVEPDLGPRHLLPSVKP